MPLISPPSRGYPDWGRVEDWDTPLLFQELNAGPFNAEHDSGVLDVSRFAYISGWDIALNNPCVVIVQWLSAAQGGVSIATRQFVLHPNITNAAQYRLVNLGPYVQFQWIPIGGAAFNHSARLWATNRAHPCEFIPQLPQLVTQVNVPIAAAANVTFWPSDYFAGPIDLLIFSTAAGCQMVADRIDNVGNPQHFIVHNQATSLYEIVTAKAPPGAWRVTFFNGANATNVYCYITPSLTGSS